jgi:hypothetical protein
MPERHRAGGILSPDLEVFEVVVDPVIELELPLLHLLEQGHR